MHIGNVATPSTAIGVPLAPFGDCDVCWMSDNLTIHEGLRDASLPVSGKQSHSGDPTRALRYTQRVSLVRLSVNIPAICKFSATELPC
jgi:hypothetical protein